MSAHFKVSDIGVLSLEQWPVTVCAWRGCCLEVFARAEHSVADCLRTLEAVGVSLGRDAHHQFAGTRLKALTQCIAQHDFGGHGKVALTRIAEWEAVHEMRAPLAHGQIKATSDGIVIEHITFDGKAETRLPPKRLTKMEMLEALAALEKTQNLLHHQLGQIKAHARKAKPAAVASSAPARGSPPR
jgi:hypothetical protein